MVLKLARSHPAREACVDAVFSENRTEATSERAAVVTALQVVALQQGLC